MPGLGPASGNSVVSQNAAAAAAAAVAAATSQASYLSGSASNGQAGQNAAAAAAAAAAALNNPSAAAAAALLPGNQVGHAPQFLFQSPVKGATIPYRPSPSSTPTCICNSSSSSSLSNSGSCCNSSVPSSNTAVAAAAVAQQQQHNIPVAPGQPSNNTQPVAPPPVQWPDAGTPSTQQYSLSQQQQQFFLNPVIQGNNNLQFLDPNLALYQTQPQFYPTSGEFGLCPLDLFQSPVSLEMKDSSPLPQSLASPSSTSSCSNYSMMMVQPQPMTFYSPAVSPPAGAAPAEVSQRPDENGAEKGNKRTQTEPLTLFVIYQDNKSRPPSFSQIPYFFILRVK